MAYPLLHPRQPDVPPLQMTVDHFVRIWPSEGQYVEFKQGLSENKVAEAVTAFSNADGGIVMLGVNPAGQPTGIDVGSELQARLHRVVARVHSPGRYSIETLDVATRHVVVLAVDRRQDGFAQGPDGRVLMRREAQNVTLVGAELADFITRHAVARFESQSTAFELAQASPRLLDELAAAWGWRAREDVHERLVECGLATHDERRIALTIAGSLLLLDDPAQDQHKYHIELFRYRDESTRYDRRQTIGGPLPEQVREATRIVLEDLGADLVVVGTRRHEIPRLPVEVLREAIANAVAHRVYEDTRRPVRIDLRPDRVVISSPGPLPEPVTVENIREQNAPRNLAVIKSLRMLGLAEDAGRGIDVMEDTMAAYLLAPPEFVDDGASVKVTLRTDSVIAPEERAWLLDLENNESFSADERRLLLIAARDGTVTNSRARTALSIDSVATRRLLTRLRDRGYLVQSGVRGGAHYLLAQNVGPIAARALTTDDLDVVIVRLAKGGSITNEQVREATGADREVILRRLNVLVETGVLTRHGERRGTTYDLTDRADV